MKTHTGFTLIEVLIAMLILAGGLLGLAALQTTSIRSNLAAYNYGQATQLLYDMADRMRANVCTPNPDSKPPITCPSATPPDYIRRDTSQDSRTKTATASNPAVSSPACTASEPCNAKELSTYDLVAWQNAIIATLPMGRGCITQGATATTYNLYITWDDNRDGDVTTDADVPANCTFSTSSAGVSHDPIFSISLQL